MFVLGAAPGRSRSAKTQPKHESPLSEQLALPELSSHATVGRNSQFRNLTRRDREKLGGIEYRSLKLLLKVVVCKWILDASLRIKEVTKYKTGYFFGLHLLGAICLVPWIRNANPKYREYLKECGQDSVWW
jgi:hypothetical protein